MVDVTAAIKYYLRNTFLKSTLGYGSANQLGRFTIAAFGDLFPNVFIHGAGRSQRYACHIINDLRINMMQAAQHIQPGFSRCAAALFARPQGTLSLWN